MFWTKIYIIQKMNNILIYLQNETPDSQLTNHNPLSSKLLSKQEDGTKRKLNLDCDLVSATLNFFLLVC